MKIKIPHNQPFLDKQDFDSVKKSLKSRWLAEGPYIQLFEKAVSKYLDRRYAKAVSSGSAALHLALLSLNLKQGQEVILSTYTCTALLNAINYVGAIPKIVDIDPSNLGPSFLSIKRALSRKTGAIIVNHEFGFPAAILNIKAFGIPIVEDCAQALGSELAGKPLGSFGDITICSFYATKMLTTGYGGMILTNNANYAARFRDLTLYDQRRDYKIRYNYCLSDFCAALGLSQFQKLPQFVKKRRQIAAKYDQALRHSSYYYWMGGLAEKPNFYRFLVGNTTPYSRHIAKLKKVGIESISPIAPFQLLHRYLKLNPAGFPAAEAVARAVFSIPIYPALSFSQISRICSVLKN